MRRPCGKIQQFVQIRIRAGHAAHLFLGMFACALTSERRGSPNGLPRASNIAARRPRIPSGTANEHCAAGIHGVDRCEHARHPRFDQLSITLALLSNSSGMTIVSTGQSAESTRASIMRRSSIFVHRDAPDFAAAL